MRWRLRTCALLVASLCANAPLAAGRTARDITTQLFQTTAGDRPDLSGQDLQRLDLANLDFKKARISTANLFGADISGADLSGADLSNAMLDRVTIIGTKFDGANLEGASLLRPSVFSTLASTGSEAPSFRQANMRAIRMFGRFNRTDFSGADLTGATCAPFGKTGFIEEIWRTEFSSARLDGTVLNGADLTHALFTFASLKGANLRGAILRNADLSSANLTGADLTGADVTGADLDGAILIGVKGLDSLIGLNLSLNASKALR